jgi:hypothetical protein
MTTTAEVRPSTDVVFQPTGHPVRWFVIVVVAVCAALWLTWWAGLLTARIEGGVVDTTSGENGIDGFDIRVVNEGPLAVEVVGVGITGSPPVPVDGVRLDAGEEAVVRLPVDLGPCYERRFRVDVRSPAGVVRPIPLRGRLGGWCPG